MARRRDHPWIDEQISANRVIPIALREDLTIRMTRPDGSRGYRPADAEHLQLPDTERVGWMDYAKALAPIFLAVAVILFAMGARP